MKNSIFFLLLVFSLSSCRSLYEEHVKQGDHVSIQDLEIEKPEGFCWMADLPEYVNHTNVKPFLYNNLLISNHELGTTHDVLTARDIETGEIVWEWNGFKNQMRKSISKEFKVIENRAYFASNDYDYCIDLNTGKTIWDKQFLNGSEPMAIYPEEGIFLKVIGSNNSIWMGNLGESQNDEKILTFGNQLGTYTSISHPQFFRNEAGDRQIVFLASGSNNTSDRQFQVRCFNMETKQYSWVLENFIANNHGYSPIAPLIRDGHIYVRERTGLHQINLENGEIASELSISVEWASKYVVFQNLYISLAYSPNGQIMTAYDLEANRIKWTSPIPDLQNLTLSLQGDKLAISEQSAFVYDALSGVELDQIDFPNQLFTQTPVALDYDNNRIFALGGNYIFCSPIIE